MSVPLRLLYGNERLASSSAYVGYDVTRWALDRGCFDWASIEKETSTCRADQHYFLPGLSICTVVALFTGKGRFKTGGNAGCGAVLFRH